MSSFEEQVIEIVADQLGVEKEEITPDKNLIKDLGADSLDVTEMIMTFEVRYGCEIPEEDAEKLTTISNIIDYLKKNVSAAKS